MAMPAGYDGSRMDDPSERTDNVDEYRRTCIDFVRDISGDYEAWVDYYKLPGEEDNKRRGEIQAAVSRSSEWIAKVAQSIKAVDVVMNDGIQKMAESTAGRPLEFGVFVNSSSGYTESGPGAIDVRVRARARDGRKVGIGFHFKDDRFRIESTCGAYLDEEGLPADSEDLDAHLVLHAENAARRDVISFTITLRETEGGTEIEKRGLTTLVHIV
ncbi:MAG: hypothetical protein MPJ06_02560 [Nitrosopumilus sp.]|nr:hypothetical protein [Nitrosopumilus sp.]MDA7942880.1 hypothetical protein [Nitrosopumilus sp.]MDA7998766.1 hypothetical protein [Nitrosopumilus sp.]